MNESDAPISTEDLIEECQHAIDRQHELLLASADSDYQKAIAAMEEIAAFLDKPARAKEKP